MRIPKGIAHRFPAQEISNGCAQGWKRMRREKNRIGRELKVVFEGREFFYQPFKLPVKREYCNNIIAHRANLLQDVL